MSESRSELRASSLTAIDAARWRLVNAAQAAFLLTWSVWMITLALVAFALTWSPRLPLAMARHAWAPPLLRAAGARLCVRGLERLEGTGPCIFVANHQSMLDIAVVFAALPVNLRFVAKKVLAFIPFLGWYMWAMGMVFVDRSNRRQAISSLTRAGAQIRAGAHVIAFPEGTRSRDGRVLPFKKGIFMLALEAQVPIVPVAIEGAQRVLPSDGFRVRPGEVQVAVGAPIPTAGLGPDDRDALMARVHGAVIDLHRSLGGRGGDKSRSVD